MENIKVTVEEPSSVRRKISVEVPAEEVDRCFDKIFQEYRRQASLPGFRRGKVPRSVIEARFLDDVTQEVTRTILPESYEGALKEAGLRPVSEPEVGDVAVERGKPLRYTAEFDILPDFEVKDYIGIELEERAIEVKEEEVDSIIEEMRAGNASVRKIAEDRGLKTGDVAMIDFEGRTGGEAIPGGSAEDFPLTVGSDTFLPGFEDSLIGAKSGEEREFFLKLPEDFHEKELAGKEASFKVRVREIRERILPDLDDAFAKDVGDYENLEALRGRLRQNLAATKELSAKSELKESLVEKLVEAITFEVPQSMVQHRRAMMLANVERNLLMRGVPKEEIEKSRDKFYNEAAGPAEKKVRATLILEAIADKEKIEVADEELQAEIGKIAEQNKMEPGEVKRRMVENRSLDDLKSVMREDKTVDFLLEKAKVGSKGKEKK